jgi:predicted nucleotidyltransferase
MAKTQADSASLPDRVQSLREDIRRIASAHGARNVRVFGSVARGETGEASDLDLLVDMSGGRTLLDLIALSNELTDRLGVEVDVLTEGGLSPYLREPILAEAVAL